MKSKSHHVFIPTNEMIGAAETMFAVMAKEKIIRPIVFAYETEILERHQWKVPQPLAFRHGNAVILDPNRSYLLSDADAQVFYAECKIAMEKAGLTVGEERNCPLLEVLMLKVEAQRLLIESFNSRPEFSGLTYEELAKNAARLDQATDLILNLMAPFVRTGDEITRSLIDGIYKIA